MPHGEIAKKAIEIIKKNPEYFEALVEFEKTGRLSKFTYKKRVNFTIDSDLLKKFKLLCEEKGIKMSTQIERLIKNFILKNH